MTEPLTILLDGEPVRADPGSTLGDLVDVGHGCAVAVNGQVVPRTAHTSTVLVSGDVVDVVTAVQGG